MAPANELAELARRRELFDREVSDAMARQLDRMNPLPTDDQIRRIAKDEIDKAAEKFPNYEETRRAAREEATIIITRVLKTIGLNTDDDKIEETGARLRRALTFPVGAWSFVKWAGSVFGVAIITAIVGLVAALFGRTR
jgi:hypothetical protein